MKPRLFVHAIFPAPYRVDVFSELIQDFDIFVAFDSDKDRNRSKDWFVKNFGYEAIVLSRSSEDRKRYRKEINSLRSFDVVVAYDFLTPSCIRLMIKCIFMKIPYFINCDGAFLKSPNFWKDIIKKFFIRKAFGFLANGQSATKYFLHYGAKPQKIFQHHFSSLHKRDSLVNIPSEEEKKNLKRKFFLQESLPVVLFVGQFTQRKGVDILLKSVLKCKSDFSLVLIGQGELLPFYKKFVINHSMKNVHFFEPQLPETIALFYQASNLFVLPTREDIWGLVVPEALSFGLPVITTQSCNAGLELIRDGENGFLIPSENPEVLTQRIDDILLDDILRSKMEKNSFSCVEGFSIEDIGESHRKVFLNAIKTAKPKGTIC